MDQGLPPVEEDAADPSAQVSPLTWLNSVPDQPDCDQAGIQADEFALAALSPVALPKALLPTVDPTITTMMIAMGESGSSLTADALQRELLAAATSAGRRHRIARSAADDLLATAANAEEAAKVISCPTHSPSLFPCSSPSPCSGYPGLGLDLSQILTLTPTPALS